MKSTTGTLPSSPGSYSMQMDKDENYWYKNNVNATGCAGWGGVPKVVNSMSRISNFSFWLDLE